MRYNDWEMNVSTVYTLQTKEEPSAHDYDYDIPYTLR